VSESLPGPLGVTVLIVEDDEVARAGLEAILAPLGYRIVGVSTGQAALDLLAGGLRPSVILLDMIVPGLDGWHVMGRRLQDRNLASIPVIIMTGLGIACPQWASALGAVDLLRKPIEVGALVEAVQRHTRQGPKDLQA
jgi:CheY-like chemotaxis protein